MSLPPGLQRPFERVYDRLLVRADATVRTNPSGRPSEVSWIERLHQLAAVDLAGDLRAAMSGVGNYSIDVQTAFIHGNPFKVRRAGLLTSAVEIGDVLFVGEQFDEAGELVQREALLLQMKVGPPTWSRITTSTGQQAVLYGQWPPIEWAAAVLRTLPGKHPRIPVPGPCRAAQFAIIPETGPSGHEAMRLRGPAIFASHPERLSSELAAVSRLDIGVDATLVRDEGWPRIVEDMLERAFQLTYADRLPRHSMKARSTHAEPPSGDGGEARRSGAFAAIVIRVGPQGVLD